MKVLLPSLKITVSKSLVALMFLTVNAFAAPDINVNALLKDMVVLQVNGNMRTLRAGQTSPEGITLISADTKKAIVEINGEIETLSLSRRVGGAKYSPPPKEIVRIQRGFGGHYYSVGSINNKPAEFLVDTGATSVVINSLLADKMGIDYKNGRPIRVSTASGFSNGYQVTLDQVSVGGVKVNNVDAIINEGAFPTEILLGNSYLARVEFNVESGVLVLQAKY